MSEGIVAIASRVRLSKVCLVRYATYPHTPEVVEAVREWKGKIDAANGRGESPEGFAIVETFNHAMILYDQADLSGELEPVEVARECLDLARRRALPELERLHGLTSVIEAHGRIEGEGPDYDPATAAAELLATLTGNERRMVRGGTIKSGVGLWGAVGDPSWLVLLYDDTPGGESLADWFLIGPLWRHEVAAHKAARHFGQFHKLHRRLRNGRKVLDESIEDLFKHINRLQADDLESALAQDAATTEAGRALNGMVGKASRLLTSLEAQRNNILAMQHLIGSNTTATPGLEALDLRRRQADQMIAQVQAELDYAEPVLQSARDTSTLHRTALLTAQNAIEKRENELREVQNRRIGFLGLWVGLMQVFSSVWLADKASIFWQYMTIVWAVIGIGGVVFWWFKNPGTKHRRETK